MSTVKICRDVKLTDLAHKNVTPTQINLMIALFTNGGALSISDLISTVRTSNSGYKFVEDIAFYKAVCGLHKMQLVVYG